MRTSDLESSLPAVDERLVAPETRYEIEDGRVVYVPAADEAQGELHARLASVMVAHRAHGYAVALRMLTRASRIDDFAPAVSMFAEALDPDTGGRQIEQVAFEITRTEALGRVATRAVKLTTRGVRRVFAIDVARLCAFEWSPSLDAWSLLERDGSIEDPVFEVPVPVAALLDSDRADAAILRAYQLRRGLGSASERAIARAYILRAMFQVLASRGFEPSAAERARIMSIGDREELTRLLAGALTCASVGELLGS